MSRARRISTARYFAGWAKEGFPKRGPHKSYVVTKPEHSIKRRRWFR